MAGWVNLPLTTSTSVSVRDQTWCDQFWAAILDKEKIFADAPAADVRWPPGNRVWERGVIGDIAPTSLTDSDADKVLDFDDSVEICNPHSFDLIIEGGGADPSLRYKTIKVHINAITDGPPGQLAFDDISDWITSLQISDVSELEGKPYKIVRSGGLSSWDRWPEWANAPALFEGVVGADSTDDTLVDDTPVPLCARWQDDQFAGKVLLVHGDDDVDHRITIGTNLRRSLSFAVQSFVPQPGSAYAIVESGAIYRLEHKRWRPWRWYTGGQKYTARTVHPNDMIGAMPLPAGAYVWEDIPVGGFDCSPVDHPQGSGDGYFKTAVDLDIFTPDEKDEESCPFPCDEAQAPDLWKSWRAIQAWMEQSCGFFIERKNYDGEINHPQLTQATFFKAVGRYHVATTITDVDTTPGSVTLAAALTLPYYPHPVVYSVLPDDVDGEVGSTESGLQGIGTMIDATTMGVSLNVGVSESASGPSVYVGRRIVVSPGWDRYLPLEFKYLFPCFDFMPDFDEDGDAIDPAAVLNWDESGELGVGVWSRRPPSTTYTINEGGNPFVADDLVRYMGDNWFDGWGFADDPTLQFRIKSYVAVHQPTTQLDTVTRQLEGVVTDGGTFYFTDDTKNWYTGIWHGGGFGHEEDGTATGGSAVGLEDTGKQIGDESGAFWMPVRWGLGFDSPYLGFTVEVQDGGGDWHHRPVTASSADGTKVTLGWDEPLSFSASGRPYRIREPRYNACLNRWQRKWATIVTPAGDRYEVEVTYSDHNTVFFAALGASIPVGSQYLIHEPQPGTVWRYATSEPSAGTPFVRLDDDAGFWVKPCGEDTTRVGVTDPVTFPCDQTKILPTIVKRYGKLQNRDYIDYCEFYNQLYDGLNGLVWTKTYDVAWHSRNHYTDSDTFNDETWWNFYNATGGGSITNFYDIDDAPDGFLVRQQQAWDDLTSTPVGPVVYANEQDNLPPWNQYIMSEYDSGIGCGGGEYHVGVSLFGIASYAWVTNIKTAINHVADLYCYAIIRNPDDPDEGPQPADKLIHGFDLSGDDDTDDVLFSSISESDLVVCQQEVFTFDPHDTGLLFRKYKNVGSFGPTNTATHVTGRIGAITTVSDPTEPPCLNYQADDCFVTGFSDSEIWSGYYVKHQVAVLKWDVSGGLEYTA